MVFLKTAAVSLECCCLVGKQIHNHDANASIPSTAE